MTDQPTPLTNEQLDQIATRATTATPGPWERHEAHGPQFYANTSGEYLRGVGDFNFGVGEQAEADEAFVRHAQQDVTALVAAVRRLQRQRKYLLGQLAQRDAETGRDDQALRDFLAANAGEEAVAEQEAAACAACRTPFDPSDTRHDGRARHGLTDHCRRCVDLCHESTDAFHICAVCR